MPMNAPINVRIGRVRVYIAATGTADPVDATMPAAGWTYMGWMAAGTQLMQTTGALEIAVDDLVVPVDTVINSRAQGIDGSFAEFVMANINAVVGGTLSNAGPASLHNGYDLVTLHASDDIPRRAVLVEQQDPREVPGGTTSIGVGRLRIWFPYCTIQPNGNVELSRKRETGIPFSIRAHPAQDGSETLSHMYLFTSNGA